MVDVKAHAIFLHVCLPGQYDNAPDLVGEDGSPLLYLEIFLFIFLTILIHILVIANAADFRRSMN